VGKIGKNQKRKSKRSVMMYQKPTERFNLASFLDQNIHHRAASKIAMICPFDQKKTYTYQDVYERSQQIAQHLIAAGIRQEERVLISLEDGFEYVCCLFAILKVGAVVVMLNPTFKGDELSTLLEYTRAKYACVGKSWVWVFEQAHIASKKSSHLLGLLSFDQQINPHPNPEIEQGLESNQRKSTSLEISESKVLSNYDPNLFQMVETHPDDPAIWLFSGGTTGRPKAVVQPHRSFHYNSHHYGLNVLGINPKDTIISIPKLFFGYATGCNLLFPFLAGATSIYFPQQPTPDLLLNLIEQYQATVLIAVPTVINRMLQLENFNVARLESLRVATSAGEALPIALYEKWIQQVKVPLLDGLGTAEMWHIFISNTSQDTKAGTLGKVIDGFEVEVRDENGLKLSCGQIGELWVKGGARALGYWQLQDKTEYAFQGEWYRSGDLICMDQDGYISYAGRKDDMVKVSGRWVAPKDIEDCFSKCDLVQEVAVIAWQNQVGLTKTKAFIQLKSEIQGEVEDLKSKLMTFAVANLSSYQIPSEIELIAEFPKTHLGKINRGALKSKQ
jgi:benzoate-CoA ligase family protein